MKNFRKKPVVIQAEQWLGKVEQMESLLTEGVIMESAARYGSVLVPTLGGNLTCRLNDYIVIDESGKRSVVDAETFEAGHELAEKSVSENVLGTDRQGPAEDASENVDAKEVVAEEVVTEKAPAQDVAETAKKASKK